jgi:hypothetical protein
MIGLENRYYILIIKKIIRFILPEFIIHKLFHIFIGKKRMLKLKEKIINNLKNKDLSINIDDNERLSIIENLQKLSLIFPYMSLVFPYSFVEKYNPEDIDVFFDNESHMRYVLYEGEKLFFPKKMSVKEIKAYVNEILMSQDSESAHRYDDDGFCVEEGDIIADIGAAEGFWALSNVRKAKKVYLFECDKQWIAALRRTFEPWKEKVDIIPKFISDTNSRDKVTLDEFYREDREINFIKADIEGAEIQLLKGGVNTLSNQNNLKVLLCTYHMENDAFELEQILKSYNFITGFSKGFMIMIWDRDLSAPYLRRGLIRGKKV